MERGHALPVTTMGWADLNWELRWPHSAKVYRRMLREDAQVKSVMKAVSLVSRLDPCVLVIDKASPAMSLVPELIEAGIEPETTTGAQMAQACGGFYDDAVNQLLCHTGDPLLVESLQVLEKRTLSGGGLARA